MLKEFFENEKIEYFSVLSYSDCVELSKSIIEREDFTPKSVIIFLLPYYTGEADNISVYATSLDYHIAIHEIGERLKSYLTAIFLNAKMKIFGDHSPISERHAALISGLGIAGDSGLLINEKYGTYIFIGDMITDIEPELLGAKAPMPIQGCIHCGACRRACPTGVLRGESEDCLSAITQKKGELSPSEIELIKQHKIAWGCDKCQTACPYNKDPLLTPIDFFFKERISSLDYETVAKMPKEEFKKRAFAWRGKNTILRNLQILENENNN